MRLPEAFPLPARTGFLNVGVLGAESTGARLARAALDVGVQVRELPAPPHPPALRLADRAGDARTWAALAAHCDVVTAASEHVSAAMLQAMGAYAPVRPSPSVLAVAQDRVLERRWLDPRASVTAAWRLVETRAELAAVVARLAGEAGCWIKPRHRRRGGPPPTHVRDVAAALAAWDRLGGAACVVEEALPVAEELVVLVARTPGSEPLPYPVAQVERRGVDVQWAALPAPVPDSLARKAQRLAAYYANRLRVEGLLAVELFVLVDGRLAVNELVPGPHPAFDASEVACVTDQYEQCIRAVCGLPLAPVTLVAPAASARLARGAFAAAWRASLRGGGAGARLVPHASAQRPVGAADGHVTAIGATPGEAVDRALAAVEALLEPPVTAGA